MQLRLAAPPQSRKAADYTGRTARVKSRTSFATAGFQPAQTRMFVRLAVAGFCGRDLHDDSFPVFHSH